MSKKNRRTARTIRTICSILLFIAALCLTIFLLVRGHSPAILTPAGAVAGQQRQLLIGISLLSLIVVVPVLTLTFYIVWKYRVGNTRAAYSPEMHGSKLAEAVWWLVPGALIIVLSVITWKTSHSLDPYRQLASSKKPLTIQVVALDWKWLFLYPEERMATVNYVQFPVDRPVRFEITADAPMNSFWIPQLGGQIYAMAGMQSELNLVAHTVGTYRGSSANLSGEGFAGMSFSARATTDGDYARWVRSVRYSNHAVLTDDAYARLAQPSKNVPATYYAGYQKGLYDTIHMKYMTPGGKAVKSNTMDDGIGSVSSSNLEGSQAAPHGTDKMDMNGMEHLSH